MYQKIGRTWNGTGATVYLCFGFVPDAIELEDYELSTNALLRWNRQMLTTAEMAGGMIYTAADVAQDELTSTEGIMPYLGGKTLTSTDVGTVTYGEGVYLKPDDQNYQHYSGNDPNGLGDAVATDITSWTLDSASGKTGHFNEDVNGTYIGEGSLIWIYSAGKLYRTAILALTASQGEATSEVTLAYAVPSGDVRFISGMYGMKPMIAGEVTKDGVVCQYAFTDTDKCGFVAELWG